MKTDIRIFDDFKRKSDFFLIDKKIVKLIDSADSEIFFSKTSNSKIVDKSTNTINEISNFKSEFSQFRTFLALYNNFIFELIKLIFMFKNLSSTKIIDFESMNL